MTRFALDTDVLSALYASGHARDLGALGLLPVVVTDVVWDELTVTKPLPPASLVRKVREMEALLRTIAGQPLVLQPASIEANSYARLRAGQASGQNAGEHSIVALAFHHADVVPVLKDGVALRRAVEELRGRMVLSFYSFLDLLCSQHGLPKPIANDIAAKYGKSNSLPLPLWW